MPEIEIFSGDITKAATQAIVNAANNSLLGGGGVDGAIHKAAGVGLLEECRKLNGCLSGQAKITKGYNLKAQFVIHTVGPIWRGGSDNEELILSSCYKNCLKVADQNKITSIAFPSISTGVYNFPIDKASKTALVTVKDYFRNNQSLISRIEFFLFSERDFNIYQNNYSLIFGN